MRLKVSIDGAPVFLDIEGPFTVTPIYISKADTKPGTFARLNEARELVEKYGTNEQAVASRQPKRIPPVPKEVKRRKRKGHKRDCAHCGRTYVARSRRSLFCSDKHRHAWMRAKGYKYPLTTQAKADLDALVIHAGASGVQVEVR